MTILAILIGGLPLIGLALIVWAIIKEPLAVFSVCTGWFLFVLYLDWLTKL
jgi:hypothetical protein